MHSLCQQSRGCSIARFRSKIVHAFASLHAVSRYCNPAELFLGKLKGLTEPEAKRKVIGHTFIEVFEEEVRRACQPSLHGIWRIAPCILRLHANHYDK